MSTCWATHWCRERERGWSTKSLKTELETKAKESQMNIQSMSVYSYSLMGKGTDIFKIHILMKNLSPAKESPLTKKQNLFKNSVEVHIFSGTTEAPALMKFWHPFPLMLLPLSLSSLLVKLFGKRITCAIGAICLWNLQFWEIGKVRIECQSLWTYSDDFFKR